jgi:hypothetical protein
MLQILVQKTRFKHVLRIIFQGKSDVSPENFFDPFFYVLKTFLCPDLPPPPLANNFWKTNKIRARDY